MKSVPGTPALLLGGYDLKALGYTVEEFFLSGTAASYEAAGDLGSDGRWNVKPGARAPYTTRMVVARPADGARFNGTVLVEWLNVSGGVDGAADWLFIHREIMRGGYAYVGVSAQRVGIEGGHSLNPAALPLKKSDPERYGILSHPGDAFSFDIYSRAGSLVRSGQGLGPLRPKRVLAMGESQSARFLVTYINAIDPLAKVYDGYFVHSRFGGAAPLDGSSVFASGQEAGGVKFRDNLRVPVVTVVTESDLLGLRPGSSGYFDARSPDNERLRVWEVAGAAHADNYTFFIAPIDSGQASIADLAAGWAPKMDLFGTELAKPMNAAPQHHYVACAALHHLNAWVTSGAVPPRSEPIEMTPQIVVDARGNAKGGVRTPWVDVPTARLSGEPNSGGAFGFLVGTTQPFDAGTLRALYPGGRSDYLDKFEKSLMHAVKAGFILTADVAEIRALAAELWPGAKE